MSLDVRYAQLDDYPRLSAFLDTYWAKDHVYVRQRSLFDWTFGRRDLWAHDGYSFALAEDHGEVVGILGGVPFVMNCFGHTFPGVWLANYLVRPDYRRGALAVRLLNMFRQPLFTVTIAFGVSTAAVPLYTALRARVLETIPRHVAIFPGRCGTGQPSAASGLSRLAGSACARAGQGVALPSEPRRSRPAWDDHPRQLGHARLAAVGRVHGWGSTRHGVLALALPEPPGFYLSHSYRPRGQAHRPGRLASGDHLPCHPARA